MTAYDKIMFSVKTLALTVLICKSHNHLKIKEYPESFWFMALAFLLWASN